jgi:hypothetical protein
MAARTILVIDGELMILEALVELSADTGYTQSGLSTARRQRSGSQPCLTCSNRRSKSGRGKERLWL